MIVLINISTTLFVYKKRKKEEEEVHSMGLTMFIGPSSEGRVVLAHFC